MDNVNEMDIVRSASTMNRLRYQATGLKWERKSEGGATSQFDTTVGTELNDLKVEIKYKQDLHGYDNPWPAGGGKNLLPDMQGVRGTDSIFIGQTDGTTFPIHLIANTAYTISVIVNSEAVDVQAYMMEDGGDTIKFANLVNGQGTYTPSDDMDVQMWIYAVGLTSVSNFQLETGSTATDYAPYENECPITGYDEAEIYLEPEYDAEADPRYTIDLDGKRYSGTIDITTGEMVIDATLYTISIDMVTTEPLPVKEGSLWRIYLKNPLYDNSYNTGICNKYVFQNSYASVNTNNNSIAFNIATGLQVLIHDDTFNTASDLIASITNAPIECLYPLAEPVTVQLDPTTITALTGHNVIWCNTGNIISVDYNIT